MAPDIFKLLMQGQAPAMDNSASQGLNQQALELMMQAQSQPQAQVVSKPNTESILLSLLPAALGAGTDYIGSLGKSYLQGQQNEMARIDRQSQLTANQLMAQAKALSGQAGDMQDLELAQFNQANQNVRNAQNNLRMNAITQANNQTRSGIAGMQEQGRSLRWKDTVEGKMIKSVTDPLKESINKLIAAAPWDEQSQNFVNTQIEGLVKQFPQHEAKIRAMVPSYPIGFKSNAAQGMELKQKSADIQKRNSARAAWGQWLTRGDKIGATTAADIEAATEARDLVANAYGIDPNTLPLPKEGKTWQLAQAENNAKFRADKFEYDKTKDSEDRDAKFAAAKFNKLNKQFDDESKKLEARHKNVNDRYEGLLKSKDQTEIDIASETDDEKKAALQKKLDAINAALDPAKKGSIGYAYEFQKTERNNFEDAWVKKIDAAAPGSSTPEDPYGQIGDGSPGFGAQNEGGRSTDLKPTDKSNKGKTLPAVNQPKAKSKAKSTQKSDSKTKSPSAPKQFSVGGTTFKKLS